jgi:hypothetical protein
LESIEKNILLFRKMRDLALKQQTSLQEDRMDLFSILAREREQIRARISRNDLSISVRNGRIEPASVRKQATEMMEVIRLIQEIDTEVRDTLIRKKSELASEIRGIREGKKGVKGYGSPRTARPAKFFDQRS